MTVKNFGENYAILETIFMQGNLYKDAKKQLTDSITASSMSDEKRTMAIQQFSSQVAIGFPNMIFGRILELEQLKADVSLKTKQQCLIDAQCDTEGQKQLNLSADSSLKTAQSATEGARASNLSADSSLKTKQQCLIDAQCGTESAKQLNFSADSTVKQAQVGLTSAQISGFGVDASTKRYVADQQLVGTLAMAGS
jgi:hypothetical protein